MGWTSDSLSHCNTLQPTATHCKPLQPTATHCNTRMIQVSPHGQDKWQRPIIILDDSKECVNETDAAKKQRAAMRHLAFRYVLWWVAVCCGVLRGVVMCCNAVQCVTVRGRASFSLQVCVAVCCGVLWRVAMQCSELQRTARRCLAFAFCWVSVY